MPMEHVYPTLGMTHLENAYDYSYGFVVVVVVVVYLFDRERECPSTSREVAEGEREAVSLMSREANTQHTKQGSGIMT